ncbi:uncharacterized protein PgNI_08761 [Pyricularia grisea]|uniref:Uncharacterized protein n=1 Tax=Pyricularia grisea TaxID=148305 RepID=A0A6P8AU28_PYRGI|nr:uncharacterized protein PgNI_08761 [Pyricularia grisea]TLD05700.1 hypothetical protein PgNI_08761 [Pyricularia grisea]
MTPPQSGFEPYLMPLGNAALRFYLGLNDFEVALKYYIQELYYDTGDENIEIAKDAFLAELPVLVALREEFIDAWYAPAGQNISELEQAVRDNEYLPTIVWDIANVTLAFDEDHRVLENMLADMKDLVRDFDLRTSQCGFPLW